MNDLYTEFVVDDTVYVTKVNKKFSSRKNFSGFNKNVITAFIPGAIREISIKQGDKVKFGEKLLVLEAMKMKNLVTASVNGTVKSIHVSLGENVSKNQLLVIIDEDKL